MEEDTNFLILITEDPETNKFLSMMLGFMLLTLSYHASVFFYFKAEDIQLKDTIPEWEVEFDQEFKTSEETQILSDAQRTSFFLEVGEELTSARFVGFLEISISYQETSDAILDPCDFVSASLRPEGVVAQWEDEENILSGSSDNCQTINLFLLVYPGYNGSNTTEFGINEQEAIDPWTNSTFGIGEFNLEVELNTQERVDGIPTQSDDDEEITVTWSLNVFQPVATVL